MLQIAAIDHIVLRTTQMTAMREFYVGVLGCEVERETSQQLGLTQLRAGNALIDLVDVDSELGRVGGGAPGTSENNLDHFCLQLKSISDSALAEHLESHAIQFGDFERRYGAQGFGSSVYINDPQGNVVELRSQIE